MPNMLPGAPCRRVFFETGKLLLVFIVGSCATIIGTLVAARVFPLTMLGADGWKVSTMSLTWLAVSCLAAHGSSCFISM